MPMDFPDFDSLKRAAQVHKFREPRDGESERDFRRALATHVRDIDLVESMEIETGKGWDKFSDADNTAMLAEALFLRRR